MKSWPTSNAKGKSGNDGGTRGLSFLSIMRLFLSILLLVAGCTSSTSDRETVVDSTAADTSAEAVQTGAAVLAANGFDRLRGKRVGLIVNHTAKVDSVHLIDLIDRAPEVELGALFGPEHGLRGTAVAGEEVKGGRDPKTGAPVFSLYGEARRPNAAMLEGLDVLVFDIQDVGARFYTYISTMGLTMQAAAEAGIPYMVLDRPNPLGGEHVAGFVLDREHQSFVGQYPIPVQHGMSVGELARMIKGEGYMQGLDSLELEVVRMANWSRSMQWPETELPWLPPSPNIPDFETALVYPGAAFFEATSISEGRGTKRPFRLIGAPWADPQTLADTLNARALPGVRFEPARFTPQSIPNVSTNPKLEGQELGGIRYVITDPDRFRPVATGVHVLHAFYHQAPSPDQFLSRPEWLTKLAGTERFYEMLTAGASPEAIVRSWRDEVQQFEERRRRYLLYE